MQRPPKLPRGWSLVYRGNAALVVFDLGLLALSWCQEVIGVGRSLLLGRLSSAEAFTTATILLVLSRTVGNRTLVREAQERTVWAVVQGHLPSWHQAQADRDLGRLTALSLWDAAFLLLALGTLFLPSWGRPVHVLLFSFALGFACIALPLSGLLVARQVGRIAQSSESR